MLSPAKGKLLSIIEADFYRLDAELSRKTSLEVVPTTLSACFPVTMDFDA